MRIIQFSQRNGELPLPWWKKGNYPVILMYGSSTQDNLDSFMEYVNHKLEEKPYISGSIYKYIW